MGTFDEVDAPYHLRRAIYDHQILAKNSITLEEDEIEIERNENGSFKSGGAVSPLGEDYLCEDNANILELMRQWQVDNIEAYDMKWYEDFGWARSDLYNDIEDVDCLK